MPGKTDQPEDVEALVKFCADKRSMQAVEVLPYHLLGVEVRCGPSAGAALLLLRAATAFRLLVAAALPPAGRGGALLPPLLGSACSCLRSAAGVAGCEVLEVLLLPSLLPPPPLLPPLLPPPPPRLNPHPAAAAHPVPQKWKAEGKEYPLVGMPSPTHAETRAFIEGLQAGGVPVLCNKLHTSED